MRLLVLIGACAVLLSATAANVSADDSLPWCPVPVGPGPYPGGDRSPIWSPRGGLLALSKQTNAGWRIEVANPQTHVRREIGLGETPTWAPTGRALAVERYVVVQFQTCEAFGPAIFVVSADGRSSRRLVDAPGETDTNPSWSPDGTRIAYNYRTWTTGGIAVAPASGGAPTIITANQNGAGDTNPVWSPDSRSLAFARQRYGLPGSRIWVAAANGSGARLLTHAGRYYDQAPSWSPEGGRLAFTRSDFIEGSRNRIWVMNADGSAKRHVTSEPNRGNDYEPAWSPDGTLIAYVHNGRVFTVEPDGSHKRFADTRRLPKFTIDFEPQWSADGSRLAFLRLYQTGGQFMRVCVEAIKPSLEVPQPL
jgi:Tol biopolymer transport system component